MRPLGRGQRPCHGGQEGQGWGELGSSASPRPSRAHQVPLGIELGRSAACLVSRGLMPGLLSQAQQCSLSSIGCLESTSEMSNPRADISFSLGPSFPLGRSRGASPRDTDCRFWTMSSYFLQI